MNNKGYPTEQPPPYSHIQQPQIHYPVAADSNTTAIPAFVQVRATTVGPNPQALICPSCHASIRTDVKYESSQRTHLMALLLCLLFWPIACVPYIMDSCQNANHYCPNCGAYIGTFSQ